MTEPNADIKVYQDAIRKVTQSKAFDRILHIATVFIFICVAGYVVYQQAVYQSGVSKISAERTQQYEELRISQESVKKAAEGLKDYIACLKRLPTQPDEASIAICKEPKQE